MIPRAPLDRLPLEGESLFARAQKADYVIDHDTGCWEWQKSTLRGYPSMGRLGKPHRVYWSLINGPVPEGYDVHHHCENTRCVNPDHLEAVHYGVHRSAHKRARSLLTEEQVAEIRTLVGMTAKEIALKHGCGVSTNPEHPGRHQLEGRRRRSARGLLP